MLPSEAFKVMTSEIEGEIAKKVGLDPELPMPITDTDRLEWLAESEAFCLPGGGHWEIWHRDDIHGPLLISEGASLRNAIDAAIRGAKS